MGTIPEDAGRAPRARGRRVLAFSLLAAAAVIAVFSVTAREWIAVRWQVHRLQAGKVQLGDLLGREPSAIEAQAIDAYLRTPRGLEAFVRVIAKGYEDRLSCGGELFAGVAKALVWIDDQGQVLRHRICEDSRHSLGGAYGEEPERRIRARCRGFLQRLPRTHSAITGRPGLTVSVVPREEAVPIVAEGIYPDKAPKVTDGDGPAEMVILLLRAG